MSVKTIRETDNYSYDIDTLYGTGWFVRKRDDCVSLLDTGTECEARVESVKTVSEESFERMAESQIYTLRWEEDS